MIILHALRKSAWQSNEKSNYYGQDSLDRFGFIHCSDIDTYQFVSPNFKDTAEEMLILAIDTDKVEAEILWEDHGNYGVEYPHIYGLLNKNAVIKVLPHLWNARREWVVNEELKA